MQLVSTLRVDPEFNLIYFNPNAKVTPLLRFPMSVDHTSEGPRITNFCVKITFSVAVLLICFLFF